MQGLRIETEGELVEDAAAELGRILVALPRRHGKPFRDLETAIEALADLRPEPIVRAIRTEPGRVIMVLAPPLEFTALIREAERLGV